MVTFPSPNLCEALHLTMHICHTQAHLSGFFIGVNQSLAMVFKTLRVFTVEIAF